MSLRLEDVLAARTRIRGAIHQTPLLRSSRLDRRFDCELYFKAEHLQKTGSFKVRGAMNFLAEAAERGASFTTYSSGNHGQALAWSCRRTGEQAVVFMPEDASPAKVDAVQGYGGRVELAGKSSMDRQSACERFAARSDAVIVPPYDHQRIIAGQGTVMLEIIEELPLFDYALIPTGGGGLLSGNSLVLGELGRRTQVLACEPELAGDAAASLRQGSRQTIPYPATIADGLRPLSLGKLNWEIIRRGVSGGLLCSEAQIREAMRLLGSALKQVVEPSGAVSLACLMADPSRFVGKSVVLILSGGNITPDKYAQLVGRDD